jgi:hypothetical protein
MKEGSETKTVLRSVRQRSKPLPGETMEFLRGIARDYARVKAYVCQRYAGVGGLEKLYPGYTVQNEMNATGFRKSLNLPYCYYAQAMFEAIADIKGRWSILKKRIAGLVKRNGNLSDAERHYIFTVLRSDRLYAAALNGRGFDPPDKFRDRDLDFRRLHSLIRRLTRKHMAPRRAGAPGGGGRPRRFMVAKGGYRYGDGGLWLCSRIPHKRVFIPLTDNAKRTKPLSVRLGEDTAEVTAPVESRARFHADYVNKVALHLGYAAMFTASSGNEYGAGLGGMLSARAERIYAKRKLRAVCQGAHRKAVAAKDMKKAGRIKANNLGAGKFTSRNEREMSGLKSYINAEINRMFEAEKPREVVIPAKSPLYARWMSRASKQKLSHWAVGYVRKRLEDKCALNGVALTEAGGAGASLTCAACGQPGKRANRQFVCDACGTRASHPLNAARNLLKRSGDAPGPAQS